MTHIIANGMLNVFMIYWVLVVIRKAPGDLFVLRRYYRGDYWLEFSVQLIIILCLFLISIGFLLFSILPFCILLMRESASFVLALLGLVGAVVTLDRLCDGFESSLVSVRSFLLLSFLAAYTAVNPFSWISPVYAKSTIDDPFRLTVCPASESNPRNSEGDIIELNDGTLLLAWSQFTGRADHASAVIAAKKSADGGRSWGREFILQDNIGEQNVMSVSFLRLRSGNILFFFLVKNGPDDLKVYLRESADEAETWSESRLVTDRPGYHVVNNARVIQLSTGRILVPAAWCADISKDYNEQVCLCYYSDDDGKTWSQAPGHAGLDGSPAMEPGLVELKDGKVLMIIRTRLDRIYQAISSDGGEHWSPVKPMDLTAPAAPATIARLPGSNELLMIWNNNPKGNKAGWQGRTPLTIAISRDEGKTWENVKNIEDNPDSGFAYTSATPFQDRILLTYYHWKKGNPNFQNTSLVFYSIPIAWFSAK